MEIEHLNIIMLNKNFLTEVALRLLLYIQLAHKVSANPERRIIYVSRRRVCKRLSISIGACRSAIKQLMDYGFISMCDSKGNRVEDLTSNFIFLNPKENLNKENIRKAIELMDKPTATDTGSVDEPAVGLFDEILGR